jgi:hypothetical protein
MSAPIRTAPSTRPLSTWDKFIYVLGGVLVTGLLGLVVIWNLTGALTVPEPFGIPHAVFTVLLGLYAGVFIATYFAAASRRRTKWMAVCLLSVPVLYLALYIARSLQLI